MQLKCWAFRAYCTQPSQTGKWAGAVFVRQGIADTLRVCNKQLGGGGGGAHRAGDCPLWATVLTWRIS